MAMAALGLPELIMLLFLGRGASPELLAMIEAQEYFASRNIKAETVGQLVALAGNAAKEPKEQVVRLLAIRTLGERKDAASARDALAKIAAEPAGFAKDYAERALAAIDGKPAKAAAMPKGSVTDDALSMFPADVDFFAALDRRGAPGVDAGSDKSVEMLRKSLPDEMKEGIYKFAESVGNLRVDRFSWAYSEEPKESRGRIMIRITGQADRKALADFIASTTNGANVQEDKTAGTLMITHGRAPAFLFVGDNDLIIAGFERNQADHSQVLQQMLEVRAGKKPSVVKGVFAKDLKSFGPEVFGVLLGALPESLRKNIVRSPFGLAPLNVVLEAAAADKGLKLRLRAETEDADQAKQLAANADTLRKQGLEGLNDVPKEVPADLVANLKKLLESVSIKSADKVVTAEAAVAADFLRVLPQTMMQFLMMRSGAPLENKRPARAIEAPKAVP